MASNSEAVIGVSKSESVQKLRLGSGLKNTLASTPPKSVADIVTSNSLSGQRVESLKNVTETSSSGTTKSGESSFSPTLNNSQLISQTLGEGKAGDIEINSAEVIITENSGVASLRDDLAFFPKCSK